MNYEVYDKKKKGIDFICVVCRYKWRVSPGFEENAIILGLSARERRFFFIGDILKHTGAW